MTGSDDEDFSDVASGGENGETFSNSSQTLTALKRSSVNAPHDGSFTQSLGENLAPKINSPSVRDGGTDGNDSLPSRLLSLSLFSQSVLLSISPWL
jgi:hypothetical protein